MSDLLSRASKVCDCGADDENRSWLLKASLVMDLMAY